ncbi:MAG: AAA family ATPase, partial [Bacteroidota bacterium]
SGLAQSIINALGVDPNTPVTYDVFSNVAQGNAEEFFNSVKENYANVREKFDNFLNTPTSSLMQEGDTFIKEWENSLMNGKENEFLDGKFLDQMFVKPAKNFIKEVENDDEFDDDFALYQISNNLKVAVDYLKSVNHPRYNEIKQLYDYITLTLQNKIIDNLSKRAEKHKVINNAVSRNMLEIVQMLFPDNPKVKSVLDVFDDEVISFDGVMTLLSELKNTLTQDEVDALLDRLSNIDYSKDFQNFPEILNKLQGQFKRIVRNPIGVMTQMIDKQYADMPPYIIKFLGDYDFYALEKAGQLKNDAFAVQLSKTFNSVIGHALIEDLLTSKKFDYSKFVEIKNELDPSPSLQQNIALTQGLLFLLNNNNKSMMLSRGIGGSGKSYMLGPSLMKIYKELTGDTKEVYAFSKSDLASKNINNAIHNDPNKGSFENFETINVDNYAYVIVDEVYTFTNEELEYIFSKTGSNTKVIMLGDPSQVKAEKDYLIDTSIKANDIRLSIPLTTSYRTNVSQISSFISRFQLTSEPVTSAVVTASDDFIQINDTSTINGVAAGTVEDIRRLASMPSTRSRVIIVGSEAAKVDFQGLSIPVLTVQESQGYQWDEVYSYLDVNDLPIDTFEKNKFYYTAYSRAKSFLFINHAGVVNTSPNSQITSNIALANKELTDAAQMYKDNLTNAKLVADILNGRVTLVPPSAFAIA